MQLKGNQVTEDKRLDRVDEKDIRSRKFSISTLLSEKNLKKVRSYTWQNKISLDQGNEGACVGFAWAHELSARPKEIPNMTAQFAREKIYWEAQKKDQYPGGEYPGADIFLAGTSVVAGAKVVQSLGFIGEYRWAFDFMDLVLAIGYIGPAVFGCNWFLGMKKTDKNGFVEVSGRRTGGHCILINSVKIVLDENDQIDMQNSYFGFQNSWGEQWGMSGFGRFRFIDVLKLWDGAETCIPLERKYKLDF